MFNNFSKKGFNKAGGILAKGQLYCFSNSKFESMIAEKNSILNINEFYIKEETYLDTCDYLAFGEVYGVAQFDEKTVEYKTDYFSNFSVIALESMPLTTQSHILNNVSNGPHVSYSSKKEKRLIKKLLEENEFPSHRVIIQMVYNYPDLLDQFLDIWVEKDKIKLLNALYKAGPSSFNNKYPIQGFQYTPKVVNFIKENENLFGKDFLKHQQK